MLLAAADTPARAAPTRLRACSPCLEPAALLESPPADPAPCRPCPCCPRQAARLDPSAPLPHLGTAQMYLHQGNIINASTELETALKLAPAFFDALKVRFWP